MFELGQKVVVDSFGCYVGVVAKTSGAFMDGRGGPLFGEYYWVASLRDVVTLELDVNRIQLRYCHFVSEKRLRAMPAEILADKIRKAACSIIPQNKE